jgi:hypothetical protein
MQKQPHIFVKREPPKGLYPEFDFLDEWLIPFPGSSLDYLATNIKARVEEIEDRTRRRKRVDEERFDQLVRTVVANLAKEIAAPSKGNGWIGTRFVTGRTKALSRYDCPAFGAPWNVLAVNLETMGLIERRDGEIPTKGWRGNAPSIRATEQLEEMVVEIRHDLRFARREDEPLIFLGSTQRVGGRQTVKVRQRHDFKETSQTLALADQVRRVNAMIAGADIAEAQDDGTLRRLWSGERGLSLRRNFTIAHDDVLAGGLAGYRFDSGGRLFGGFWQTMPKIERHRIRVDGRPVALVDFRSMNAHIAYSLAGVAPPPGDLYAVPGLEDYRSEVKILFNAMLSVDGGRKIMRWPTAMVDAGVPPGLSRIGPKKAGEMVAAFIPTWQISSLRAALGGYSTLRVRPS